MARDNGKKRGSTGCNLTAMSIPATQSMVMLQNLRNTIADTCNQLPPDTLARLLQSVDDIQAQIANELQDIIWKKDALSPLDGRYSYIEEMCGPYFSEYGLVKRRITVQVKWVIFMLKKGYDEKLKKIWEGDKNLEEKLSDIYKNFGSKEFAEFKAIEKKTRHDVKAGEYYIRKRLDDIGYQKLYDYIHIGCTSEDVTNLAYALALKEFRKEVLIPELKKVINELKKWAKDYKDLSMLARTHGQPATPTTFGHEIQVFVVRLEKELKLLQRAEILGKYNGATGSYAAMAVAYPGVFWPKENKEFVESLDIKFSLITTQIEPHDYFAYIAQSMSRICTIISAFDRDMWLYIMVEYCKQRAVQGEVGSSTMTHKVNPIDFENSEGNAFMAITIFNGLANYLPMSRLQRDLRDSTIQRNIGMAFGYVILAFRSLLNGLSRTEPNAPKMKEELANNPQVLGEAIQTVLRSNGYPDGYKVLAAYTRGKSVTLEDMRDFVRAFKTSEEELTGAVNEFLVRLKDKERLLELLPENYTGYAAEVVEMA